MKFSLSLKKSSGDGSGRASTLSTRSASEASTQPKPSCRAESFVFGDESDGGTENSGAASSSSRRSSEESKKKGFVGHIASRQSSHVASKQEPSAAVKAVFAGALEEEQEGDEEMRRKGYFQMIQTQARSGLLEEEKREKHLKKDPMILQYDGWLEEQQQVEKRSANASSSTPDRKGNNVGSVNKGAPHADANDWNEGVSEESKAKKKKRD